jgi:rhomboid protease GluP
VEKRRMCPHCRAFVSVDDKKCPYCDSPLGARAIERRTPTTGASFIPPARFTTVVILLLNAGLYLATALYSMKVTHGEMVLDIHPEVLRIFGAKTRADILDGQWWRLIMAGFLHGGILHILMNSWVIFDLGATVEEVYGTSRYLVLYFVSTIGGFIASTWWSSYLSIGASAALFGLIGAMIAVGVRGTSPLASAMRAHYTQWAIWGLAIGLLPGFRIDNAAHIGGLASGFALAYMMGTPALTERWTEKLWKLSAVLCVLIAAWAFVQMMRFFMAVQPQS